MSWKAFRRSSKAVVVMIRKDASVMKAVLVVGVIAICVALGTSALGTGAEKSLDKDAARLLELHREMLAAHRDNDVDRLLAVEPDEVVSVSRGEVRFPPKDERYALFKEYLESTEFEEYRDLIDPIVRVSEDGTLGWLICQVKIAGTRTLDNDEQVRVDSVWAWIELYEKKNGRWYRVGDVSNVKPVDSE